MMVKPVWNYNQRVNYKNFAKKSHPDAKRNMVPRAVLIKSGIVNTAKQKFSKIVILVNTARQVSTAHPKSTMNAARSMSYLSKTKHSTVQRPIYKNTSFNNSNVNQRVNTVRSKTVNTARPKAVVNAVKENIVNGNPQIDLQDKGVTDSGCSRHIAWNMSYLTDYEEIDGGYVAFGGNHRGEKITRKVEPNQPNDVSVVPEPVLVDEDEDPKEEDFKEEEESQEEEDDMEVDIKEDDYEPELTYPYEKVDHLNPLPPASNSEPVDVIKVDDTVEFEDKIVLIRVHEVGKSSTTLFLREDNDDLLPGLMRREINSLFGWIASLSRRLCGRETTHALVEKKGKAKNEYYVKLILDLGNEVRSSVEEGIAAMENLVKKLGNAKEKVKCIKLTREFKEARYSKTLLRMQNERVERDLYWTRVRAYEFYREMIHRGFVFEERPNEAIDVLVKDEKSPSSELRGL
uniref:Uncharacterized protein n=1 Tax=Tanacetum cinerariifolium TaxID=118510 RepID=A0A699IDL7_TANCI|nr:hypothetical protein [Tanacetum cinerariifolium]